MQLDFAIICKFKKNVCLVVCYVNKIKISKLLCNLKTVKILMHIYRKAQYEKRENIFFFSETSRIQTRVIIHLTLETISKSIFIFYVTMIIGRPNFHRLVFLMYRSTCLILLFGPLPFMLLLLIHFLMISFQ